MNVLVKAESVAKAINDAGGKAVAIPGDMLDAEYIDDLVKKAAEFGGGKIHIIVNNAGFTWDAVIHKVCHFLAGDSYKEAPVIHRLQRYSTNYQVPR